MLPSKLKLTRKLEYRLSSSHPANKTVQTKSRAVSIFFMVFFLKEKRGFSLFILYGIAALDFFLSL